MNCTSCGANLPQGAAQCPLCGNPTSYNVAKPAGSPQYDPTVVTPQPGPGNPPQIDPTIAASPFGGTPPPPSTAYGTPSYGTPPNPYNTPPATPYPYNMPPQQQNLYGTPPPPQQGGYVAPPPQQGYGYGTPPPPKRRSRLGLILGIIALVLVVACAGISFAVYQGLKQTGNTSVSPSGQTINTTAAAIITGPQTSSAIDNNFAPTKPTTTFTAGQDVYVTFNISSNGQDGYIEAKWYQNGQHLSTRQLHHSASNDVGYFSKTFTNSGDGIAELYWCTKADCSDEKLAQVVKFTVATASIQPPTQTFKE